LLGDAPERSICVSRPHGWVSVPGELYLVAVWIPHVYGYAVAVVGRAVKANTASYGSARGVHQVDVPRKQNREVEEPGRVAGEGTFPSLIVLFSARWW
jgi:hypothetical protein